MTKLNYLPTWQGVTYVCFITGAFSWMIVGWRAAAHKRIEMVLDALEMARWQRNTCFERFCCCSDAGSQAHLENESRFLVATDVVAALRHGAERPTRATDQEIGSVECEEDDRRAAFRRACTECSRDLPT